MSRYKVIEGSQSYHCCFCATIVDTTKPLEQFEGFDDFDLPEYDSVCECFDIETAEMICAALNKNEESK
mgnify:CR=1 FL=1